MEARGFIHVSFTNTLDDYFNQFNLVRQPYESTFKNAGVNKNKTLKFWGSGINTDWYGNDDRARADVVWSKNEYTQNDPGLNIVQPNLFIVKLKYRVQN